MNVSVLMEDQILIFLVNFVCSKIIFIWLLFHNPLLKGQRLKLSVLLLSPQSKYSRQPLLSWFPATQCLSDTDYE